MSIPKVSLRDKINAVSLIPETYPYYVNIIDISLFVLDDKVTWYEQVHQEKKGDRKHIIMLREYQEHVLVCFINEIEKLKENFNREFSKDSDRILATTAEVLNGSVEVPYTPEQVRYIRESQAENIVNLNKKEELLFKVLKKYLDPLIERTQALIKRLEALQ